MGWFKESEFRRKMRKIDDIGYEPKLLDYQWLYYGKAELSAGKIFYLASYRDGTAYDYFTTKASARKYVEKSDKEGEVKFKKSLKEYKAKKAKWEKGNA